MNKGMKTLKKAASSLAVLLCLLLIAGCGSENTEPARGIGLNRVQMANISKTVLPVICTVPLIA